MNILLEVKSWSMHNLMGSIKFMILKFSSYLQVRKYKETLKSWLTDIKTQMDYMNWTILLKLAEQS